jgi:hypothetical protein
MAAQTTDRCALMWTVRVTKSSLMQPNDCRFPGILQLFGCSRLDATCA